MMKLFIDQERVTEEIRASYRSGKRSPMLVAPCGFGKTVVFSYITHNAIKLGNQVLLLAHRSELIDQISRALEAFGVPHGIIAAGYDRRANLPAYVASVQTLVRRPRDPFVPSIIIIDEAHHSVATTYGKIVDRHPRARRLGVTATPCRMSGAGLGTLFDDLILGPDASELIALGRLSPLRVFAPPIDLSRIPKRGGDFITSALEAVLDKPSVTGSAVDEYRRHAHQKPAVVFCVSVAHTHHVAQEFRDTGYVAVGIDGDLEREVRRDIVRDFGEGKINVLTSCDLISEGFDCPRIECGISLRPTDSLGLWDQQVGRIIRTFPGKREALLFDHGGNTMRHGLCTQKRVWSLEHGHVKEEDGEKKTSNRVCPICYSAQNSRIPKCGNCGYLYLVESRKIAQREGRLKELTAEEMAARGRRQEVGQTKEYDALVALGTRRGYRDPGAWAQHVIDGRLLKQSRKVLEQ